MDGHYWQPISKADPRGAYLYRRHYSYRPRAGRPPAHFAGPGELLCLLTSDGLALWVWQRNTIERWDHQQGVNCAVFRNEGPVLSSLLVEDACQLAWQRWPGERLYTYVKPSAIRSTNPGYCFKSAGWSVCGQTKVNKLVILERKAA